ncbi:MAG: FliM/FliN family flagellar motor switch protein, partial [Allosphingosinicella sp.]
WRVVIGTLMTERAHNGENVRRPRGFGPIAHAVRLWDDVGDDTSCRAARRDQLAKVWSEVVPVRPQFRSRENSVGFANLARNDEPVAVTRFVVKLGRGPAASIDIIYPVSSLRSVEQELLATSPEDVSARGEEWRERLVAAVGQVRVKARTVLARPDLSLAELMQLRPGDVIPIDLPAQVPLLVEGRSIALGTIGEHDGRAALKIEKLEKRRTSQ